MSEPRPGWTEKLTKQWAGLRLAHEATMLEDARTLAKTQRRLLEEHQRLMLGLGTPPKEEDDVMHVGDVQHIYPPPPTPAPAAATSKVLPWLAAAALGVGGLAGGYGLSQYLAKPSEQPPAVNTMNGFLLELGKPDVPKP